MTDRDVKTAFKGQPVTITLDKEVDVSRGCVITKDTNLASYQELTASILWMDDEQLTAGKDYLVKLGTKTISGIVSEIKYAVDVNTGEHISADSLTKNGIAVCTILLAEPIAVDLFSKHKTLGELILIDRVSNMTSACGVVDSVEEKADDAKRRHSYSVHLRQEVTSLKNFSTTLQALMFSNISLLRKPIQRVTQSLLRAKAISIPTALIL